MKISAIDNTMQSVNAIKFGTRHEESNGYQTRPHNTGIVKAVPLAVLIAMSPMTTANAETRPERIQPQEIEYVEIPSDQQPVRNLVLTTKFEKASPLYGDATLEFYDTDGDKTSAEVLVLKFTTNGQNIRNATSRDIELELTEVAKETFLDNREPKYSAVGKGKTTTHYTDGHTTSGSLHAIQISSEFVNYLREICDEDIPFNSYQRQY